MPSLDEKKTCDGLEVVGVEGHHRTAEDLAAPRFGVVSINRRGVGERGEGIEALGGAPLRREAHRTERRRFDLALDRPIDAVHAEPMAGIDLPGGDEPVAEHRDGVEHVAPGRFRHERPPVGRLGRAERNGDQLPARRVAVGENEERIAVVADDLVERIEPIEERLDRGVRPPDILHEHAALRLGAFVLRDDQVPPVVGHLGAEEPVRVIGPLVHENVLVLRRAQAMEVELLVTVRGRAFVAGLGRPEARVVETRPVVLPRRRGELRPVDGVDEVAPGRDLEHTPLAPVQSPAREAVCHQPPVVGARRLANRDRPVRCEGVRIDQHLGLRVERPRPVEDRLILQAVVLREDVVVAFLRGQSVSLVVPQLAETRAQPLARGNRGQIREGERVLRFHPCPGLRAVVVLEPAIGIGNRAAEIVVDLIDTARLRVHEWLRIHGRNYRAREPCRRRIEPKVGP